jgi:hypothetical protein
LAEFKAAALSSSGVVEEGEDAVGIKLAVLVHLEARRARLHAPSKMRSRARAQLKRAGSVLSLQV